MHKRRRNCGSLGSPCSRLEGNTMRRRDILIGAGSIASGISLSFPAPAIAQRIRELKMVTAWPKNSPGLQTSAERLAQSITVMSEGHLKITVYAADTLVRPFEVF